MIAPFSEPENHPGHTARSASAVTAASPRRFAAGSHPGILARTTLDRVAAFFDQRGHNPSVAMWAALEDLATTLERMADGTAPAKFFLSSLDPGVGKTQTIAHFVDALLSMRDRADVGVMICVGRLDEVKNLAETMAVPRDNLCVLTSDQALNALGAAPVDAAQVLITTQQRIERQLNCGSFAGAAGFHYRGRPRAIRIWDESYLPGQTVTLNRDDVAFLFKPLRFSFPGLTDALERLFTSLRDVEDGTVMELPNFGADHSVDLNDVLAVFDNPTDQEDRRLKDDQRMALSSLWFLSGKTVSIRTDGKLGNTVIDYRDTLPEDLAPMVILDASGRVRETYRDIEKSRGTLVRLRTAVKRYDNLAVHLWRTGGGKRAFQSDGPRLVTGIARTIDTKPDERWLVIMHRRDGRVGDVEREVRERIAETPAENVTFIHWGQHMATNCYGDVPNVVLAGTLFYRVSYYEALKRLAAGRRASQGDVTREERERVMIGEHAHAILQALCRGAVRKCDGEQCHPCHAYVIASVRSGIPDALPALFPGCRIHRWQPVERKLSGHVGAAVEALHQWAQSAKAGDILPFKRVFHALGVTSHDFKYRVRVHPEFVEAAAELGVVETGKGRNNTGFALA